MLFKIAVASATSVGAASLGLAVIITNGGSVYPDPVSTIEIESNANK